MNSFFKSISILNQFIIRGNTGMTGLRARQKADRNRRILDALDSSAKRAKSQGDPDAATRWLQHAHEIDPGDPARAIRLADSLAENGNRAAALRVLRATQQRIRSELGIDDDPGISRKISSILG